MICRILRALLGVVMLQATVPVQAQELDQVMARLMAAFPGTYDTTAQVAAETAAGVPEARRHERRYVVYARIDAPQIGPHVLFRQERKGGPDGPVAARGLAVFAPDPEAGGVRMWLRNIVDADRFADLHLRKDLWPTVGFDPAYGGKCPFHWRVEGGVLTGTLAGGGCSIVSNAGKPMSFDSRWTLTDAGLSIFDNTYDGAGQLLSGRTDRVPTEYRRIGP
ncbi:MAG: hypothetical protein SFV21_05660 [Rhodospirillaceae bacterium]|nr:hypothetical protein [Rhodospirillaceae bacterium]